MITAVPECGSNKSCMTSKTRIENVIGKFDCTTVSNCFLHQIIQYLPLQNFIWSQNAQSGFLLTIGLLTPVSSIGVDESSRAANKEVSSHTGICPQRTAGQDVGHIVPLVPVVEIYFHWAGTDADSIISTLIVGSS